MNRPLLVLLFVLIAMVILPCEKAYASKAPEITTAALTGMANIKSCQGSASADANMGRFTVSGTGLTDDIKVTAQVNFEVSIGPGDNFSNEVTIPAIAGTVNNVVVRVRLIAAATAGFKQEFISLRSAGAQNHFVEVSGTVSLAPTVEMISAKTYRNAEQAAAITLDGTGNLYTWTVDNTAIGLPASGRGEVPTFKAINNGTVPVKAKVTVTPQSLPLLMVAIREKNTISTINTLNDQTEGKVTIRADVSSIALSPNNKMIYTVHTLGASAAFPNLYGFVIATGKEHSVITATAGATRKVLISPDGTTSYEIGEGNTHNKSTVGVTNISGTRFYKSNAIYLDAVPTGGALSPDGKRLYVTSSQAVSVTSYNTGDSFDIKLINTGLVPQPNKAVVSPDGTRLFVAGVPGISVINTATNAVVATLATTIIPGDLVISPDGKTLYVSEPSANRVLKFDLATGSQTGVVTAGQAPRDLAVSADGLQLFVSNTGETSVSLIDVASFTVAKNIPTDGAPSCIVLLGGSACPGVPLSYEITVNPTPTLTRHSSPNALDTEFGTPSAPANFRISGYGLTAALSITPPAGFELSSDGNAYSDALSIPASGTMPERTFFIRLKQSANADPNGYAGNIVVHSDGATDLLIPMPLSNVRQSLLTLRANDKHKTYGEMIATPAFGSTGYTITAGALKNGNTITSVTLRFGTGRIAGDDAGTYRQETEITEIIGGNGFIRENYTLQTTQKGDIIVDPADLTIKADNVNKVYGDVLTNGTVTTGFTATGLQNQQRINSVSVSYGDGAAAAAVVKGYPGAVVIANAIGSSGFKMSNYKFNGYTPADITVTPATITATINNATRKQAEENPAFTASYTGFVNGQTQAIITQLPLISTTATRASAPGKYLITASGGVAPNYIFNYIPGELTVTGFNTGSGLSIINTITPNGDGINDTWNIGILVAYPKCTVDVFGRSGQTVFSSVGYTTPWDGTFKGKPLDAGTYYYVIKLNATEKPISGSITLIR